MGRVCGFRRWEINNPKKQSLHFPAHLKRGSKGNDVCCIWTIVFYNQYRKQFRFGSFGCGSNFCTPGGIAIGYARHLGCAVCGQGGLGRPGHCPDAEAGDENHQLGAGNLGLHRARVLGPLLETSIFFVVWSFAFGEPLAQSQVG